MSECNCGMNHGPDGLDSEPTIVIFRKWRKSEGGEIIALFPEIPAAIGKPWLCDSYMHIGQHGAADYFKVLQLTAPAKPAEYADLLAELAEPCPGFGYRLVIRQRETGAMRQRREVEYRRMMAL